MEDRYCRNRLYVSEREKTLSRIIKYSLVVLVLAALSQNAL